MSIVTYKKQLFDGYNRHCTGAYTPFIECAPFDGLTANEVIRFVSLPIVYFMEFSSNAAEFRFLGGRELASWSAALPSAPSGNHLRSNMALTNGGGTVRRLRAVILRRRDQRIMLLDFDRNLFDVAHEHCAKAGNKQPHEDVANDFLIEHQTISDNDVQVRISTKGETQLHSAERKTADVVMKNIGWPSTYAHKFPTTSYQRFLTSETAKTVDIVKQLSEQLYDLRNSPNDPAFKRKLAEWQAASGRTDKPGFCC